ncbi:MAG: metallophosphoesterase family protein [Patescibacteria group bacterium]
MRILAVADKTDPVLYDYFNPARFPGIELILACGDLEASYLSFLVTVFKAPLFYVRGNHDLCYDEEPPEGCDNIDGRLVVYKGWRIAGLEGSNMYNPQGRAVQATQGRMKRRVMALAPKVLRHHGLDIFIAHAPPRGVHDRKDPCHQGFEAWRDLIRWYKPRYIFHGHAHLNYGRTKRRDLLDGTEVIDAYGHIIIDAERGEER